MRASGILLPISSLPSPYGIGTLGKEAFEFVDFLKKAGQSYWQVLPLGPTSYGDSPYQTFSAFAGNPYFIDLDLLAKEGLLKQNEYRHLETPYPELVDYEYQYFNRFKVLRLAYSRFNPPKAPFVLP
jgi:4-alpha-glucanotransferase